MRSPKRCSLQAESLEGRALLSVAFVDHGPNNSMRNAETLQLDPTDGQASVVGRVSRGDQDVYRLNAATSGTLQLSLSDTGRNPVEVDAFSSSGRLLHTTAQRGTAFGTIPLTAGSDVFLRVRGLGRGVGAYQIILRDPPAVVPVNTPPTGNPLPTPNSSVAPTSFTLDAAGKATLTGTIPAPGGSDVYTFTAPKTGRITFSIRRGSSNPLSLTVSDSSGKLRLNLDTEIPSYIAFISGQQGETYTLRVTSRGDGPAPYVVTVSER